MREAESVRCAHVNMNPIANVAKGRAGNQFKMLRVLCCWNICKMFPLTSG